MRTLLSMLTAILIAAIPAAAAADVIVLRSDGPSARTVRVGTKLRDGTRIRLQRGDQLLILEGRGTRLLKGPSEYVVGATRVPAQTLTSIWRQPNARVAVAATRLPPAQLAEADRRSTLVDRAVAAAAAGRYPESDQLLRQVEAAGFGQRLQCRVVSNLRLHNLLAQSLLLPPEERSDPCGRYPVPANLAALLRDLDAERQSLLEGF